jgi:predicted permease
MRWTDGLGQDVRYGWRGLRHRPAFAAVAILSLALGVGANSALFSLVDGLLRRPLPVREPNRLVLIEGGWTNPIWEQIRDRQFDLFDGALAWSGTWFDLAPGGVSRPVNGLWVSGGFFEVLGVRATLGRTLTSADDRRGGGADGPVAVISHRFWRTHYEGAPDVVGRVLVLDRVAFTVVGVIAPDFTGPEPGWAFEVAIPIGSEPLFRGDETALDHRSWWWLDIMARLKPGQTIGQATVALRAVQSQIGLATLPSDSPISDPSAHLRGGFTLVASPTGTSTLRDEYRRALLTLFVVAGLVLLVSCANIANLLLARASERGPEFTTRRALGASRSRLARQLLTEGLLLSVLGAAIGFLFAQWGSRLLVRHLSTTGNDVFLDVSPSPSALGFTGAIGIATALLFSAAPIFHARRSEPKEALRAPAYGLVPGHRKGASGLFVVAQVALSLVLVVSAGLFLQSFSAVRHRELGFDRDAVLIVGVYAERSRVAPPGRAALWERLREAAASVPGVAVAAASEVTPLAGGSWNSAFSVTDLPKSLEPESASVHAITPGWLAVYGTRVLEGRDFEASDQAASARVAIVNEAFARKFFGIERVLDRRIRAGSDPVSPDIRIVGLVENAVYKSIREEALPTVYLPMAQALGEEAGPHASISVRAISGSPTRLAPAVVAAIRRLDPTLTLTVRSLADQVDETLIRERLLAILSGFFGGLALLLAAIGLCGVTSHAVARRRGEIGVRMALGADAGRVVRLVLGRAVVHVVLGVAAGAGLSLWASRFVESLLYGLEPGDPITIAAAAALLVAVALLAAYLPARRAARIDPAKVLREG